MRFLLIVILLNTVLFIGCKESSQSITASTVANVSLDTNHPSYVSDMEAAHNKDKVYKNQMLCFNLDMTFGSSNSLMKIFTTPNSSSIRVDKKDGTSTIMMDGKIYTNSDSTQWSSEKFGIYTYQYFFMAPYKLSDAGTKWSRLEDMEINGEVTERSKLTFEPGTGDAPDDWYMVHADPHSHLIKHIGYIVTGGNRSVEEAEKSAHAISYKNYEDLDGVLISRKWIFSKYDKEDGLGKQIGEGTLRNVDFMDVLDQFNVALTGEYTLIN